MKKGTDDLKNGIFHTTQREERVEQNRIHPCPACDTCTREKVPDYCGCFRNCPYYLCWLKKTWLAVTAPLRRAEAKRELQRAEKVGEGA